MKFGLSEETINRLTKVFENNVEVDEVIIYGSRAKGNYKEGSDIDITLKGMAVTDKIKSKIIWEIDELNTPYLFDISIFSHLNSTDLEEQIHRVGKLLYKKANF